MRTLLSEPLGPRTTFRVGGPARELCEVESERDFVEALRSDRTAVLLGGGSNVVISDEGIGARVIAIRTRGIQRRDEGSRVSFSVAAGEPWDDFVAHAVSSRFSGLECLSGIPGLVGATPIQNVGAYGQEVKDTIVSVRVFDRDEDEVRELSARECEFRYRDSALKSRFPDRFAVLSVTFSLSRERPVMPAYKELSNALAKEGPGAHEELATVRATVIRLRRGKSMVLDDADPDSRSAGSFFTNPLLTKSQLADLVAKLGDAAPSLPEFPGDALTTKVPAAWLIERAGFTKGFSLGNARISTKHALALVNAGDAKSAEIIALARTIRDGVRERFGVTLHTEPVFLGFPTHPLT